MTDKRCIFYRSLTLLLSCFLRSEANAQQPPARGPLADFVNDPANGASQLQQAAGNAVQLACWALNAYGQALCVGCGFGLTGQEGDLVERCNEMVQTAADLQGHPDTTRSLGLENDELLAVMQHVSGEELHSQNTMSTRVTNGQF